MSKRIIEHPEPKAGDLVGPNYWRGLDEKAATPEFKKWLHQEFPEGSDQATGFDRRNFLKLMGASFGLAGLGLAGCREPRNHTLPYAKQPENLIPGVPVFFASSFPGSRGNTPVIVETHEFRPTKIEGNKSYAAGNGATNAYAQASILDLYDPDRAAGSQNAAGRILSKAEVTDAVAAIAKAAAANAGAGYAFLAAPSTSPTRARLVASLKKRLPQAVWAEYEPVDEAGADRAVSKLAGKSLRIRTDYSKAKRILSLDRDFLESGDDALESSRGFASGRRVDDPADAAEKMNRLYAVESVFSLTGATADHRLRAPASSIPAIAALLVAEILTKTGGDLSLADSLNAKGRGVTIDRKWITESVADLVAHKGAALVVAGDHLPESVHAVVALANAALGAEGSTVTYVASNDTAEAGIAEITAALKDGKVTTLVVLGGNPAYDAPSDLGFEALAKKARVVRLGYHGPAFDETSALTRGNDGLFLAASHYLESWGDGRAPDGTYVPVQPMIEPLFPSVNELDVLAAFAGVSTDSYNLVKETFVSLGGSNFEAWLAEGVLAGSAYAKSVFTPAVASVAKVVADASFEAPAISKGNLELRITPSSHTFDGRYANNGWLVEAPNPMTKTNWENVIIISPKFAKELKVEAEAILLNKVGQLNRNINELVDGVLTARVAKLTLNGKTVEGPLYILPGMPDWTVNVQLGFGRRAVGRIGSRVSEREFQNKTVGIGFDVYPLVTSAAPAYAAGLKLELVEGKVVQVANTQAHWSMEGRDIIREANVATFVATPDFAKQMGPEAHAPKVYGQDDKLSLELKALTQPRGNSSYDHIDHSKPLPNVAVWQGHEDQFPKPQQWGMTVDLNTCTGCNACVIACQAENNIPIVGRDQTLKGRDMRWMRLDRYFFDGRDPHKTNAAGEPTTMDIPEDPQVSFMSMSCLHCETAPCESVCPANATVHDAEGLNTMAYNRCIGTRYCANNCPYKVRRFNFLDYNDRKIGHLYEGPLGEGGSGFFGGNDKGDITRMQKNPNVTVRMRGVMEKCTYCVQRIQEAKIAQKVKAGASGDVRVKDGELKVACQQVCAADAIVFGDVSDENSEVSKSKRSKRDYAVLGFLNTRPRTSYLAKLRNPNMKMPNTPKSPLSLLEYEAKSGPVGGHHDHAHGGHAAHGHEAHGHEAGAPKHPGHN